jgi:hypothetical protein
MFYGKPIRLPKRMLDMLHACIPVRSYVHVDCENDKNIKMSSFVQWAIKATSTTVAGYELRTLYDLFGICSHS